MQVKMLEQEVEELKAEKPHIDALSSSYVDGDMESLISQLAALRSERDGLSTQQTALQQELNSINLTLQQKQSSIDSLSSREEDLSALVASHESTLLDKDAKLKAAESKLKDVEAKGREADVRLKEFEELVGTLKEALDAKTSKEDETAAVVRAKDMEIDQLNSRFTREMGDVIEQNKELSRQVDELRMAGQVSRASTNRSSYFDLPFKRKLLLFMKKGSMPVIQNDTNLKTPLLLFKLK